MSHSSVIKMCGWGGCSRNTPECADFSGRLGVACRSGDQRSIHFFIYPLSSIDVFSIHRSVRHCSLLREKLRYGLLKCSHMTFLSVPPTGVVSPRECSGTEKHWPHEKIVVNMKCLPGARHCTKMLCMHCPRAKKKQFNVKHPVVFPQTTNRLARACYEISCKDFFSTWEHGAQHRPSIQGWTTFPTRCGVSSTFSQRIYLSVPLRWCWLGVCFEVWASHAPRRQVNKELWSFWHLKVYYFVGWQLMLI